MRTSLSHCRERQAELYFILLQPQTFAQDTTAGQLPQYLCWVLLPECDGESWVGLCPPLHSLSQENFQTGKPQTESRAKALLNHPRDRPSGQGTSWLHPCWLSKPAPSPCARLKD